MQHINQVMHHRLFNSKVSRTVTTHGGREVDFKKPGLEIAVYQYVKTVQLITVVGFGHLVCLDDQRQDDNVDDTCPDHPVIYVGLTFV